ncbi:hypothetical protein ACIRBZ_11555 [Streptomyces sp. NPDC094038]|uniref:hypothetical protein n=1 Tax=Streptomyces sp. NPDC094038 TaxID=3366055 RepID=UPI00381D1669
MLRGSASGLTGGGAKLFSQDTAGVPGSTAAAGSDSFGDALSVGDANGDGSADGAPCGPCAAPPRA